MELGKPEKGVASERGQLAFPNLEPIGLARGASTLAR